MFSNSSKAFLPSIAICCWVIVGFFSAQFLVGLTIGFLIRSNLLRESDLTKPLSQLVLVAVVYSLALVIIVLWPRLFRADPKIELQKELGITKKPRIQDAGLSMVGYGAYLLLTISFSLLIQSLWRGFNVTQAQSIGFHDLEGGLQYILAFVALVIIAPIVEELLFRGYLFGKLRARLSFLTTTLVTSALFGLVHLQWNVGVDVFALSLVLCYMREKTGAVWAGIVLHMIKNSIAFMLLFLHPEIVKNLL